MFVIKFSKRALKDYCYWQEKDPKKVRRINSLCKAIKKDPYRGMGKPEPLRYDLQKYWSRRIDKTHRLIYTIEEEVIYVASCRHHY